MSALRPSTAAAADSKATMRRRPRGDDFHGHDEEGFHDNDDAGERGGKRGSSSGENFASNFLRRLAAELDKLLLRVHRPAGESDGGGGGGAELTMALRWISFFAFLVFFADRMGWGKKAAVAIGAGGASSGASVDARGVTAGLNVLSFSLYGSESRYTDGILANARLYREIYGPDWSMRVYHDDMVPKEILRQLKEEHGVELVDMSRAVAWRRKSVGAKKTLGAVNKSLWRLGAASDKKIWRYCIRNADSRPSEREKAAVDEWSLSGEKFHVMRDHPSHSDRPIPGGMWCGTRDAFPEMKKRLMEHRIRLDSGQMSEEHFLGAIVWPKARQSVMQHDAFSCESVPYLGARPFPTERKTWDFVGAPYVGGKLRRRDYEELREAAATQPEACRDGPKAKDEAKAGWLEAEDRRNFKYRTEGKQPEPEDLTDDRKQEVWGGGWDLDSEEEKAASEK